MKLHGWFRTSIGGNNGIYVDTFDSMYHFTFFGACVFTLCFKCLYADLHFLYYTVKYLYLEPDNTFVLLFDWQRLPFRAFTTKNTKGFQVYSASDYIHVNIWTDYVVIHRASWSTNSHRNSSILSLAYIYLEPKWPLFWLEKTLFWRLQPPK